MHTHTHTQNTVLAIFFQKSLAHRRLSWANKHWDSARIFNFSVFFPKSFLDFMTVSCFLSPFYLISVPIKSNRFLLGSGHKRTTQTLSPNYQSVQGFWSHVNRLIEDSAAAPEFYVYSQFGRHIFDQQGPGKPVLYVSSWFFFQRWTLRRSAQIFIAALSCLTHVFSDSKHGELPSVYKDVGCNISHMAGGSAWTDGDRLAVD